MILTYHEIVPKAVPYVYSVTCDALAEQLTLVQSLTESAAVRITFDDGHASHHRYGLPLLSRFGCKGIFFVTAGWTGVRSDYMDWGHLAELVAEGHEVQSHGWSHKLLTACSEAELAEELCSSRARLQDRLSIPVDAISLPGGRSNAAVLKACARSGYSRIYTSDPWMKANRDKVQYLGRFMVRRTTSPADLRRLLAAENRPWHPLRLWHPAKRTVRMLFGDRFYQHLWRKFGAWNERDAIAQEYANQTAGRAGKP